MKCDDFDKKLKPGIVTRYHIGVSDWVKEEVEKNKDLYINSTEEEINKLSLTLATGAPSTSTFIGAFNDAIAEIKKGGKRVGL